MDNNVTSKKVLCIIFIPSCRYRDRFWRKIIFDGVSKIRQSLDEVYGVDKVSLASATFRWMNHHSAMKQNGESYLSPKTMALY